MRGDLSMRLTSSIVSNLSFTRRGFRWMWHRVEVTITYVSVYIISACEVSATSSTEHGCLPSKRQSEAVTNTYVVVLTICVQAKHRIFPLTVDRKPTNEFSGCAYFR